MEKILEITDLTVEFDTQRGPVRALDGIELSVYKGQTLGVVGESGSGKSVTALSIMGLIPNPPGKIVGGEINYRGENLVSKSNNEMRKIRGKKIAMIFQEPMTSLNPVFTCGKQIEEVLKLHVPELDRHQRRERVLQLLDQVGIPDSNKRIDEYPHQLSGGMRQRIMISMALACDPDILIADEPTTALDVTIQAQILELINKIKNDLGMGIILITHDLGVVFENCDDVAVMYCGKIVETAKKDILFENPTHPYTKGLIDSVPDFNVCDIDRDSRLSTIDGVVPSLFDLPSGCRFQNRCPHKSEKCTSDSDSLLLREIKDGHKVRCHLDFEGALL